MTDSIDLEKAVTNYATLGDGVITAEGSPLSPAEYSKHLNLYSPTERLLLEEGRRLYQRKLLFHLHEARKQHGRDERPEFTGIPG